jgi:outer membrane protein insertion porin family
MLGLLGFDWGYGFDTPAGSTEISGNQFHFIMGQQF